MVDADDHRFAGFDCSRTEMRNLEASPILRAFGRRADLPGWLAGFCLVDLQPFQPALRCLSTGVVDANVEGEPHGKDLSSIAAL